MALWLTTCTCTLLTPQTSGDSPIRRSPPIWTSATTVRAWPASAGRRDVEPYRLVNWGRRWYLVAFDPERDDWRTFRVDRITPRTPNGPRFARRELPEDVVDRVRRGVSAAAWRHRARILVHAPAEVVAEQINPAVGTVEPVDQRSCLLHTGADRLETIGLARPPRHRLHRPAPTGTGRPAAYPRHPLPPRGGLTALPRRSCSQGPPVARKAGFARAESARSRRAVRVRPGRSGVRRRRGGRGGG
ncbi:WYL domain-containing protein [Micromonospora sp. 4G57]|uniref:WYL domain-containing protein n=1 Tax=Micromonospora sicca TaxID=2202420 RepID=A0ABU5JMJ7_9ACTN|nr:MULTISPECIES: WYL domain-containing protein [unclassified Micromonospora]MDZ5441373.1 WYL domain-containing protein [Micromonospora sp. 4G57]MDZ5493806.1 WYL domain-containing protein [Micromonospora sp. 4G53]